MHVLYVLRVADSSGVPKHIHQLIRNFQDEFELGLVYGKAGWLTDELSRIHAPVTVLYSPALAQTTGIRNLLSCVQEAVKLLRKHKPSIVHVHGTGAAIVWRLACYICSTRCLVSPHGWMFTAGNPLHRRLYALSVEYLLGFQVWRYVSVSQFEMAEALRFHAVARKKISTIENGIPDNPFVGARGTVNTPLVVLMVARFYDQKDHLSLIKAVERLPQGLCQLHLAGDGPSRASHERYVETAGLSDRVRFLGDRSDIPDLMTHADIFALISHYESMPLAILEAMRGGMPVVASRVGGNAEVVEHGRTGYLVKRGSVEEIRQALRDLLSNDGLRLGMGQLARRKFEHGFTEVGMVAKYRDLYLYGLKEAGN